MSIKLAALLGFGWMVFSTGLAAAEDPGLLIENVTLIDGTGRAPIEEAWVLVEGERIVAISSQPQPVADSVRRVDGTGKFLIPGLIDSHIHLPGGRAGPGNRKMIMDPEAGLEVLHGYLYSGVTSVYDSGNHGKYIHKLRSEERAGRLVSPRIFATISLIAPPDGHGCCAGGTPVNSYKDAVAKLEPLLQLKPDLLKLTRERRGMGPEARNMPLLPEDLFKQVISYANERGVATTVHVSEKKLARQAIDAGASAFAHLPYLDKIDSQFANLVAVRKIVTSTTITRNEADVSFYEEPAFVALMTPEELEVQRHHERYVGTDYARWLATLRPIMFHNIRELYRAGAILALGTDRTFGAMPHQELKLLVEAGIPPSDALRIGTLNAAVYMGVDNELGSIEVGKLADMVLLRQDPTVDIGNTTSIETIFKGGEQIDRTQLNVPANRR